MDKIVKKFVSLCTEYAEGEESILYYEMLEEKKILIEKCKMTRNDDSTITLDITIKKARTTSMDEIMLIAEHNEDIISVDL